MSPDRLLQRTWDASYPKAVDQRLWPTDVVPMVDYAKKFFSRGATILDLPCGDGKNIFALAEIGPLVAADSSDRALEICEARKRRAEKSSIVVMKADVYATPFVTGTFESIFCCDLLGHLPDAAAALRELRRIMSHNGTAIVTLFSERDSVLDDPRMVPNDDGSYWFQKRFFFRFYSQADARAICSTSGFEVCGIEEFTWVEPPHPGYREYEHTHSSWALALRRIGP